jgi:hypothetical protein
VAVKGEVAPSYITTWAFDINAGDFTSVAPNLSGLLPGDNAYNGLCFSPTLDVLYTAFYDGGTNTTGGFPSLGAFGINLDSGVLTGLGGSPYTWFTENGFTGSDCIAVTRNGKWAYVTDYTGDQIGFGAVNTTTGVLDASATLYAVGSGPTSVAVAGVVQ